MVYRTKLFTSFLFQVFPIFHLPPPEHLPQAPLKDKFMYNTFFQREESWLILVIDHLKLQFYSGFHALQAFF